MKKDPDASIACSLDQAGLQERRDRWQALAARAAVEVAPTDRGLRLTFAAHDGAEDELRKLAALERECCAFAAWLVHSTGPTAVLDITADTDQAVAAVQGMFSSLRPTLATSAS